MILELLVQDWEANRDMSLALALDAMTVDFNPTTGTQPIYKRVFDRLSVMLDEGTRHVLNMAAMLGHRLNDLSLYALADLPLGQTMAAMTDLVRHRILRDSGTGLEFVNEFVRAAAYLEVPSTVRRSLHSHIADYLMAEDRRGIPFLGLEIAWHATRAGKVAEMPSFLLKGAREAIAKGALDSAVRALETALPQLAQPDHSSASLLLAEGLQEQGRWTDSASVLAVDRAAQEGALGKVYSILAEHRTTLPDASALQRNADTLLQILQEESFPLVRLKAGNAAAQMMNDIRSQSLALALLSGMGTISREALKENELHQLDLCRAQLLYHSGQQWLPWSS